MLQSPGSGEKGSAIDLGLGPAIDEHAARNYRTIKAVSTFSCLISLDSLFQIARFNGNISIS